MVASDPRCYVRRVADDDTRDTLESAVAAIERARSVIGGTDGLDQASAATAIAALDAAQSRLVQLWFGDDRGQDTLFAEGI